MTNWDDLETFVHVKSKLNKPLITISKTGIITLNSKMMQNIKMKRLDNLYTVLAFSKKNNAIILAFIISKRNPGTYATVCIKRDKNNKCLAGIIAAKQFLKYYKIELDQYYGRYIPNLESIIGYGKCWSIFLRQ